MQNLVNKIVAWYRRLPDVVHRAVKTFWQSAVAAVAIPATGVYSLSTWKGIVISAVAAGASAVWNKYVAPAIDSAKRRKTVDGPPHGGKGALKDVI